MGLTDVLRPDVVHRCKSPKPVASPPTATPLRPPLSNNRSDSQRSIQPENDDDDDDDEDASPRPTKIIEADKRKDEADAKARAAKVWLEKVEKRAAVALAAEAAAKRAAQKALLDLEHLQGQDAERRHMAFEDVLSRTAFPRPTPVIDLRPQKDEDTERSVAAERVAAAAIAEAASLSFQLKNSAVVVSETTDVEVLQPAEAAEDTDRGAAAERVAAVAEAASLVLQLKNSQLITSETTDVELFQPSAAAEKDDWTFDVVEDEAEYYETDVESVRHDNHQTASVPIHEYRAGPSDQTFINLGDLPQGFVDKRSGDVPHEDPFLDDVENPLGGHSAKNNNDDDDQEAGSWHRKPVNRRKRKQATPREAMVILAQRGQTCCANCALACAYFVARWYGRIFGRDNEKSMEWLLGGPLSPQQKKDVANAKRRFGRLQRHLYPPNPCDIPEHRLERFTQVRLVLIMWIHGIGGLLIGGVGGGAYANGMTWRPELGAPIGPPLSLATLAVLKGVTCLLVFGVLFQRVRIPPCLASLGCAPIPPKPKRGRRPMPYKVLTGQMLKRLMGMKLLDLAIGLTLLAALRSSIGRSRLRQRGDVVKFVLALLTIGIFLVDVYGLTIVAGTSGHYIHHLWFRPDLDPTSTGWESSSSSSSSDDEDFDSASPLLPRKSHRPGPTMRFADPGYAREYDSVPPKRSVAFSPQPPRPPLKRQEDRLDALDEPQSPDTFVQPYSLELVIPPPYAYEEPNPASPTTLALYPAGASSDYATG